MRGLKQIWQYYHVIAWACCDVRYNADVTSIALFGHVDDRSLRVLGVATDAISYAHVVDSDVARERFSSNAAETNLQSFKRSS